MGGMFTILKVREELPEDGSDPGWYTSPSGTLAQVAPEENLKRDGIEVSKDPSQASALLFNEENLCGVIPSSSKTVTARVKTH
ncbi:MAG: hypothetical protein R3F23_07765 [Verrucomicrobiia bacterium]